MVWSCVIHFPSPLLGICSSVSFNMSLSSDITCLHVLCFFMLCIGRVFGSIFDQKMRKSAAKYKSSRMEKSCEKYWKWNRTKKSPKKMNNKRNGKECKKCQMHVSKNSNKNMSFLAHLRLLQKKQKNIRSRGRGKITARKPAHINCLL